MKRILGIILVALLLNTAFAQINKRELNLIHYDYGNPWRFGFSLGLNVFNFNTVNSLSDIVIDGKKRQVRADVTTQSLGFDINAIINYRLSSQWQIRTMPGISFGSRKLDFFDDRTDKLITTSDISSNYCELPVQVKFCAVRQSNMRPYVFAGPNLKYNMTSGADSKGGVFFGTKNVEIFGEFGFGFEFYLRYFRFSVEAKFCVGDGNVLAKKIAEGYEQYYKAIDKLRSNMFVLKFNFE